MGGGRPGIAYQGWYAAPMERPNRIYLVGAHATGKTTLARMIRDRYGLPMISEVARGVLAEMEAQVDQLRTNLDLVDRYQLEVFERQIEAESSHAGGFVSDRAFCNLAYAAHHSTILPRVFSDPRLGHYMDSVRQGVVFFLRPQKRLLVQDGVRETLDWEDVLRNRRYGQADVGDVRHPVHAHRVAFYARAPAHRFPGPPFGRPAHSGIGRRCGGGWGDRRPGSPAGVRNRGRAECPGKPLVPGDSRWPPTGRASTWDAPSRCEAMGTLRRGNRDAAAQSEAAA